MKDPVCLQTLATSVHTGSPEEHVQLKLALNCWSTRKFWGLKSWWKLPTHPDTVQSLVCPTSLVSGLPPEESGCSTSHYGDNKVGRSEIAGVKSTRYPGRPVNLMYSWPLCSIIFYWPAFELNLHITNNTARILENRISMVHYFSDDA